MTEKCPCGLPLHYHDPVIERSVRAVIAQKGEMTKVTIPGGTWEVSRHYIALHGLKAQELPNLGFKKVD